MHRRRRLRRWSSGRTCSRPSWRSADGRWAAGCARWPWPRASRPPALVLLSYPLHPPGKPDSLRVDHFGALDLPCLFVSGTKDPFGSPAEIEAHTAAIPGPVTHVWIEGAGHEVKDLKNDPRQRRVIDAVAGWLQDLG